MCEPAVGRRRRVIPLGGYALILIAPINIKKIAMMRRATRTSNHVGIGGNVPPQPACYAS
jgi:hypothetical protein